MRRRRSCWSWRGPASLPATESIPCYRSSNPGNCCHCHLPRGTAATETLSTAWPGEFWSACPLAAPPLPPRPWLTSTTAWPHCFSTAATGWMWTWRRLALLWLVTARRTSDRRGLSAVRCGLRYSSSGYLETKRLKNSFLAGTFLVKFQIMFRKFVLFFN